MQEVITKSEEVRAKGEEKLTSQEGETFMAKYGKTAQKKVKKAMHERKKGTLKSGSGQKVKSKKQAIAIGLSEARKAGGKVPKKKGGKKKGGKKKSSKKK